MKKLILPLLFIMSFLGCATLNLKNPDGSVNIPQLLVYAQDGIDADCALGIAPDVCTFGTDLINLSKGKSPAEVKKLLLDAEVKFPKIKPYIDFVAASIN